MVISAILHSCLLSWNDKRLSQIGVDKKKDFHMPTHQKGLPGRHAQSQKVNRALVYTNLFIQCLVTNDSGQADHYWRHLAARVYLVGSIGTNDEKKYLARLLCLGYQALVSQNKCLSAARIKYVDFRYRMMCSPLLDRVDDYIEQDPPASLLLENPEFRV